MGKRSKKLAYQVWKKKCDNKYQEIGLEGEPICESCGAVGEVIHHYYPKSLCNGLRYDRDNGIILCKSCHFKHHNGDPEIHNRINYKRGKIWQDTLERKKLAMKNYQEDRRVETYKKIYQTLSNG